jgi:DNA repair ATPase RecN
MSVDSRITNRRKTKTDPPAPAADPAAPPAVADPAAPPADAAVAGSAPTLPDAAAADQQIAGLAVKPSDAFENIGNVLQPLPLGGELDMKIARANDILNKMQTDVSTEKDWAKSVHDIIENYQFKYSKSLSDIAEREKRVNKLKEVKDQLTQARLHTGVEEDIDAASKNLDDLTSRLGPDAPASKDYSELKNKVTKLKKKLDALSPNRAANAKDADQKIDDAIAPIIPPASNDALAPLVNAAANDASAESAASEAADQAPLAAPEAEAADA